MKIRRMIEAATQGKWYLLESPWLQRGMNTAILAGTPDPHGAKFVCDFEIQKQESADDAPDTSWEDAALITALKNNAPALADLVEAAQLLCRRVEIGEIRSRKTYAQFKGILSKLSEEFQND